MFDRIGKLLTASLAAFVLFAFVGCSDNKGPVRKVDDKDVKTDQGKPDGGR